MDHIIPLARGGTDTPENRQLAHRLCNEIKSDRLIEELVYPIKVFPQPAVKAAPIMPGRRMEREMLTTAEAARLLGIKPVTVRWRLETGKLAGENYGGRVWMVPRAEVERAKADPLRRGRPAGKAKG